MAKIKAYGICIYKVENKSTKILLCKSVSSLEKWGCLKGVQESNESQKETACREFSEECNIKIPIKLLNQYFEQINSEKNIGIYLVNDKEVKNINQFFLNDTLHHTHLSWENSKVKFFDIKALPPIKKKQSQLILNIIDFLKNKNLSH